MRARRLRTDRLPLDERRSPEGPGEASAEEALHDSVYEAAKQHYGENLSQEIIDRMKPNDIVMTQDIPLAALVIEKGGIAIHPRGEVYTSANVKARLHLRDFMDTLRGAGVQTGGPPPISERDKREFSSALDQTILKQKRKTA